MKLIEVNLKDLKPYKNNPRHNDNSVDLVKNSIESFGYKVPIIVDKDFNIIAGHTRLKALQKIDPDQKIQVVYADDLTPRQAKAFRLADNKVSENSTWNIKLLTEEIRVLDEYDFTDFGFEFNTVGQTSEQRNRTYNSYNMDYIDPTSDNIWGFPNIDGSDVIPKKLVGFNKVLSLHKKFKNNIQELKQYGVHFFIDDYQFERLWNTPEKYMDKLSDFGVVFTPDFSLYTNMPLALQIYNVYRSRSLGYAMEEHGVHVIPTVQFSNEESYFFCFDNLENTSTVAISSLGVVQNEFWRSGFQDGFDKAMEVIKPKRVLFYGSSKGIKFPEDIEVIKYEMRG